MPNNSPPWELVPEMDPNDPESHGVGEAYILIDWLRFWQLLRPDQQAIAERYNQYPVEIDRVALRAITHGDTEGAVAPRKPWWQFWR
ncbi:MAG: hypothetical protein EON55_12980 [Alphaproteobacteria bacterium]|nr:MAG: hypothetical protein EON55_12980 [Alphaproteobacteria bacterium]